VFAASSLGGEAREHYAAMEAGGGAVAAPPKKGAAQRPASRRPPRQKIDSSLGGLPKEWKGIKKPYPGACP
jgi:hypothetical protein